MKADVTIQELQAKLIWNTCDLTIPELQRLLDFYTYGDIRIASPQAMIDCITDLIEEARDEKIKQLGL